MRNAFDRAERWRQRAAELRGVARYMQDRAARSSLEAIAAALEGHARKIEEMALKMRHVRSHDKLTSARQRTG